ncbi:partner and localizer of BRCA2 [Xiphias gladius]|uniref:partner and localizer of BRCA2 n=1 Tax=Xiphias gladius TaxID=8245 RepID=UPI001A97F178|nr:partner and localizer of BRCA2 [Xiphias gladius]XP_040001541.1 partner and localizer of BRCA2 [Xiphias gladius]XP_040001542.1 partner and localizer of BRCA2 [Xiphias gladius]XP_040001543.1 partner and localizer of BRCA2 [Xiphias gladius]
MESNVEEHLRTTLHYDDKEKLRRKLAQLQREYLRTAQRLQRAEHLETVRRHVRSRITQQNQLDQRDPEVTFNTCPNPSSLALNTANATAQGVLQRQGHVESPAHSDNLRRSQVIRFLLPSDAACPQTPDPSHDAARDHRPSPALRLRSRRSRLRWERRSAEAGTITDNSQDGHEQRERMEGAITEGEEEKIKSEGTEVVNESEELFSASESESPSLLLPHWNAHGHTETGDMEGKKMQGYQEQREKESQSRAEGKKESELTSLLVKCWNSAIHTEESGQDCTPIGREEIEGGNDGENSRGQSEITLFKENSNKDMEQNAEEKIENEKGHDNTMEIKEEKSGIEGDGKSVGLLDSCTLVEGLLFPAEYYVRTTRRMTFSQSQPDMQAVILSQLSTGRHRRSRGRGRGRGSNRHTYANECSDQHTQADFSSLTTASVDPHETSHVQTVDTSAELTGHSQSSSEISDKMSASQTNTDAFLSPAVSTSRPGRGRKRKRGRGRGRGRTQTPRSTLSSDTHQTVFEQTSQDPQPTSTSVSSSPSLHEVDGPNLCLTPGEPVLVPDDPQPVSTHSKATQPSSGVNGSQYSPASGHPEMVYPIFLKNSGRTNRSKQMSKSTSSWRSLLLPSSPTAQTSLLPLLSLSPGSLVNNLMNFDLHQDFHLPDDQFASLKLHKLHQVAVESGVEHFASPSYNTRSSIRHSHPRYSTSDPVMPLPLPLSLTPTIANSQQPTAEKQAATQSVEVQNLSADHELASQSLAEEPSNRDITETPEEQQTENLHAETLTSSTESVSVVREPPADCVAQNKEQDTLILNTHSQGSISANNTHRSIDHCVKPQPHMNFADRPSGEVNDYVVGRSNELKKQPASEKHTDCAGEFYPLEDQRPGNHQREDKAVIKTLSFDCSVQETPEEPSNSCTAVQTWTDCDAPGESHVKHVNVKSPTKDSKESSEPTTRPPRDRLVEQKDQNKCSPHHSVHSQLLSSPPPASAPCPFITPHLPSSVLPSSPMLPTLGLTPHPVATGFPQTCSPSAPALTLPPPHSPTTQALSPPALSPCLSITSLPPSQPLVSPSNQDQASSEPSDRADQCHRVEPATCPTASSIHSQGTGGQGVPRTEQHVMRCTHTLKAPAGGCLVDTCCLPGPSGGLCVAAAGKWAVCLWSQTPASDWSLIHTWTFNDPVINVFPVPDAAGLVFVTLGQLEIREVRMLSCSSLMQVLLCEGVVQAVVGVSRSRVVTSSHSATGSNLQVFKMSDNSSKPSSQPLASPGVCVGALAPVDGLSDALIGTDEGGRVFVWNLKTGQLLRRIVLGDGLSNTACLRGYSYRGVLFVLLQHQLLSSLEEEEEEKEAKAKDEIFSEEEKEEERKKTALFSLVAVNPLSSKSVLATRLYPPKAWSGRLCEADVNSSSVVGLSQSGCVCVWELGRWGASRMVWAPESEGWQLARWGGRDMLVTGHHNGDVTLHCYSTSLTSLCR